MKNEPNEIRSTEQLYALRKQVILLYEKHIPIMKIVELTGLSWPAVNAAINLFEKEGRAALKPAKRGRKSGTGRMLSPEQEQHICQIICDKRPEQLKMDFALWNRAAVKQLIKQQYDIDVAVRTMGKYLNQWGFTPQKPIKKAYEQRPEAVQQWLDEEYPDIQKRAKAEGGEIHWGDETALVNTDVRGRSYAPAGKTPVTYTVGGTRQKLSMLATVTNQGKAKNKNKGNLRHFGF
jgi:transposase